MAKKAVLLGPPGVGKGHVGSLIRDEFPETLVIGTGNLVRKALEADAVFRRMFGPSVAKGDLVPDDVMWELFVPEYKKTYPKAKELLIVDGLFRTEGQVHLGVQEGIVTAKDAVIIFTAYKAVCKRRYLDRIKRDPTRTDGDAFEFRNEFYQRNSPDVNRAFAHHGLPLKFIHTNGSIPNDVYPEVLRHLQMRPPVPVGSHKPDPYRDPFSKPIESRFAASALTV